MLSSDTSDFTIQHGVNWIINDTAVRTSGLAFAINFFFPGPWRWSEVSVVILHVINWLTECIETWIANWSTAYVRITEELPDLVIV
jgi:phage-related holin